jgi:hypothetical protein
MKGSGVFLSILCLMLGAGCTADQFLVQAGIPGTSTPARATLIAERAGYIDAVLETGGTAYRFLFPDNDECRSLLEEEAELRYAHLGPLGRVTREEQRCDPVGLLSLAEWRDRRPRRESPAAIPREQATFEVYYSDDELVFARGRFPLAFEIGWAGGVDTIGVFPNREPCASILAEGVASMEFRPAGKRTFSLVTDSGLCPIEGFVLESARREESS